jgi:DNA-binding winged helix-turn-helix (wHTH) protein
MDQASMESGIFGKSPETELRGEGQGLWNDEGAMRFGEFRVLPAARTLTLRERPVPLGSRAFDLLVVLLRSRGRLVTKQEIVSDVWPSTFVDESNLRFQMAVLRKALGAERERIKTIPGRGYLFAAEDSGLAQASAPGGARPLPAGNSKASPERVVFVVEADPHERNAIAILLRALRVNVLSVKSVDDLAAFARSAPCHVSA